MTGYTLINIRGIDVATVCVCVCGARDRKRKGGTPEARHCQSTVVS